MATMPLSHSTGGLRSLPALLCRRTTWRDGLQEQQSLHGHPLILTSRSCCAIATATILCRHDQHSIFMRCPPCFTMQQAPPACRLLDRLLVLSMGVRLQLQTALSAPADGNNRTATLLPAAAGSRLRLRLVLAPVQPLQRSGDRATRRSVRSGTMGTIAACGMQPPAARRCSGVPSTKVAEVIDLLQSSSSNESTGGTSSSRKRVRSSGPSRAATTAGGADMLSQRSTRSRGSPATFSGLHRAAAAVAGAPPAAGKRQKVAA